MDKLPPVKKEWMPIGVYRTFPLPILPIPEPVKNNFNKNKYTRSSIKKK